MKSRTNNKIVLCQNCYGTLTPSQKLFCHDGCRRAKAEAQAERDLTKKIVWAYMNTNMLDLCRGERAIPHEFSHLLYTGQELTLVAVFDEAELLNIGDAMANTYDGWYREVDRLTVALETLSGDERGKGGHGHQPRAMRQIGLFSYLCDQFGIATERNIAAAIGTLTDLEGHASPIDFINSL